MMFLSQVLTSPSILMKPRGKSVLPQLLVPKLTTPASCQSSSVEESKFLRRGPPLSPLQDDSPILTPLTQMWEGRRSSSTLAFQASLQKGSGTSLTYRSCRMSAGRGGPAPARVLPQPVMARGPLSRPSLWGRHTGWMCSVSVTSLDSRNTDTSYLGTPSYEDMGSMSDRCK